ncbi:hypothetical protein J437_LFUL008541 [Ladona fulva]|uniref:Uncharacterized protein n=1 Tax=Ladona fulva TaxID=123851 RepID=A0A8K0P2E4_LADFU|nr:hypothetical protein J437_LFUL008541 [Ladona fulva]
MNFKIFFLVFLIAFAAVDSAKDVLAGVFQCGNMLCRPGQRCVRTGVVCVRAPCPTRWVEEADSCSILSFRMHFSMKTTSLYALLMPTMSFTILFGKMNCY